MRFKGKQYATLGFAISPYGDRVAVLLFEPRTKQPLIHIYDLSDGEVASDRWLKFENEQVRRQVGQQVPRLAFDSSGKTLAVLSAWNQITIWNLETGAQIAQFENETAGDDNTFVHSAYTISLDANLHDWAKYGRWAMREPFSQRLALSRDGRTIAAGRGGTVVVRIGENLETIVGEPSSSGQFALAENGEFMITYNQEDINFISLIKQNEWARHTRGVIIAICRDPAARIALTHDSEMVAIAMSHFDIIKLWHLPDGRMLGTL
jgi:WD40 repeat protein